MASVLVATVVKRRVNSWLRWSSLDDDITVGSLFQRIILNVTVGSVALRCFSLRFETETTHKQREDVPLDTK